MKDRSRTRVLALALLFGLPLTGVWLTGKSLAPYLEFPPRTMYVEHRPFSWIVFLALALVIALSVGPVIVRIVRANVRTSSLGGQTSASLTQHSAKAQHFPFPWWGWLCVGWTVLWWELAWTRFPWMSALQAHTFTPLWLGYVAVVNAWTFGRTGRCMMLHRPRYFLSLFPLSAGFWWVFEYLNRFVQNWYYVGAADLSPAEYVFRATIPFSTVLPAVIGTAELLTSFPAVEQGLARFKPVQIKRAGAAGWLVLVLSCLGLLGIGRWPDFLFPWVWVGPLLLMLSLQTLAGRPTLLSPVTQGDWRGIWTPALAALICGFWWELWNWKSLAHWEYAIPLVGAFQVFEMPLLGYAGYLPFGVECVVVADWYLSRQFSGGVKYYMARDHAGSALPDIPRREL